MMNATTNTRVLGIGGRAFRMKYVLAMCALLFALIMGRAVNDVFFYAFAAVSLLVFAVSSIKHCIPLLLFLLPFASILKPDVNSVSIFTLLFLLVVGKMVIFSRKMDALLLICLLVFVLYGLIFSGTEQAATVVTMAAGVLLLYYVREENIDVGATVLVFAIGICLSSVLALLKDALPVINTFVTDTVLKLEQSQYAARFSGLQGNPNYYTMDIIVAMAAIIVLMYQRKSRKTHVIALIALAVFGLMSVSKSFLVSLACLALCWFFVSMRQGLGKLGKFLVIVMVGAVAVYCFAYDYINTYLIRFMGDEAGTLDDVTTGRLELWLAYLDAIFNNIRTFLFGNGLKTILASVEMGAHNTYLESLFSLGVVGLGLLIASVKRGMGKIKMGGAAWMLLLVLAVRMFAIGILTYDNLWFYLMIFVLISNEKKQSAVMSLE